MTASRGYDWGELTGQAGPWILPDWRAVARVWDGIHVSVGGYLSASNLAVEAGTGLALLTGWQPDQTLWLHDVFAKVEYLTSWQGIPGSEAIPVGDYPWLAASSADQDGL